MCLPDRVGISLAVFVILLFGLMHMTASPEACTVGQACFYNAADTGNAITKVLTHVVLPAWIVLRVLDFMAGGPARRRGNVRARIIR